VTLLGVTAFKFHQHLWEQETRSPQITCGCMHGPMFSSLGLCHRSVQPFLQNLWSWPTQRLITDWPVSLSNMTFTKSHKLQRGPQNDATLLSQAFSVTSTSRYGFNNLTHWSTAAFCRAIFSYKFTVHAQERLFASFRWKIQYPVHTAQLQATRVQGSFVALGRVVWTVYNTIWLTGTNSYRKYVTLYVRCKQWTPTCTTA